jgi:endonuclease YncB( thermonuclease family)
MVGPVFAGCLALSACAGSAVATSPAPSVFPDDPWVVSEVVDGDTLHVTRAGVEDTLRLIGINSPEDGECWSDEATAALIATLGTDTVTLERDVSDRDAYGRMLRYVRLPSGEDVGGVLIDGGHAIARAYPPDTARDAGYRERQRQAREAARGMWAPDACGPRALVAPDAIGIEVHPDAAGDDSVNLNDEWVRFSNLGAAPIDLEGWTARDESSSHRYHFAALVLPPGGSTTLRSGCGVDTDTDRHWCVSGSAVWNNAGDTVFLLDPAGNVVAQLGYPLASPTPGQRARASVSMRRA